MTTKRVLLIYFTHSGQTRKLIQAFAKGLDTSGVETELLQLKTVEHLQFPLPSLRATAKLMVTTFFRRQHPIQPIDPSLVAGHDLVVLAGPTWSYNVSGPVLSFFKDYGSHLAKRRVLPLISCRGYWRTHYWHLKSLLAQSGALSLTPTIFLHPGVEPWRTVGVFLKLIGKNPELSPSWLAKYYRRFGHTREQIARAQEIGAVLGKALRKQHFEDYRAIAGVQDMGEIDAERIKT